MYRHVRFEPVPGTLSCADHPAAVGPFVANPSSMGRVVVKHGIGLAERFAAGVVPTDLDAPPGR